MSSLRESPFSDLFAKTWSCAVNREQMQSVGISFISAVLCLLLAGCGIQEALDSTKQIPSKMDETNKNMEKTLAEMKKTTAGVHDQSLLIPLENMLKNENYDALSPVPFKLMPYGKKFAEAATADELMDLTFLWLKEVDESLPDKDIDPKTGDELPYTKQEVSRINNEKLGHLEALQVIAGFTPDATVNDIIQNHIVGTSTQTSGRYEDTAYAFLMFRVMFIRDVLLQEDLLAHRMSNIGKLEQAIIYASKIDFIARLRFANKIGFSSHGLIDDNGQQLAPSDQPQEQMAADVSAKLWNSISDKAVADLQLSSRTVGTDANDDQRILSEEKIRLIQAQQTLQSQISYWSQKVPQ